MTAVTQRIDNYLGGVSRQSDDKKLPGQVRECINGYPDPTFGLTKRPGFKWIANLGTGTTYDDSKWFYIARTSTERYIGCIKPALGGSTGDIDIWNADTGAACTVNYGTGAQAYLTGARTNYDVLHIQDTSIITNNLITAAKIADPTFVSKTRATLVLAEDPVGIYQVTINGSSISPYTAPSTQTYDGLLTELKTRIDGLSISGLTVTKYAGTLELDRVVSGTRTAFTISCKGGVQNNKLSVFQDQVDNVAQLPLQSFQDHVVKVVNTPSDKDTYFAKFVADDGTSGTGYWEETLDPQKSTGLDNTTMPHELINNSANTFTFQKVTYTSRTTGDDVTNPHPSFIGSKIEQTFFHSNRLGFLSKDNVSLSQAGEYYNFYHTSAQTITDADPIDLSASTIRPAALHAVIPTTQGLILFSKNQQFMMYAADGVLTPTTALIRSISNYEMDTQIDPIDMGTSINFISKTPGYTRVFGMVTRGQDENPRVLDVSRVVSEWVPPSVDTLIASPQNQFIALSDQDSRYIYFFRTYSDGEKNLIESWYNWELPGTVQGMALDSDDMFTVTKQGSQFTLSKASLSQSPEDAIIVNNDGQKINPCMDLYAAASSVAYDTTNDFSKCYIPWNNVTTLTPVLVVKGTTATGNFIESGFTITPDIATDGTGTYYKVPKKNLTSIAADVIVGWKYDLDIKLPRTYVKLNDAQTKSDFTANLTLARMKFAVGLSGVMGFKLKSIGTLQGSKTYTGDGTTTVYNWAEEDLTYVDKDQIKLKINGIESTAFTVTGDSQITLTSAATESKTLTGNNSLTSFDLTFTPRDPTKIRVTVGGVLKTLNTDYYLVNNFINFTTAPPAASNNIKVYSADDIEIYLDQWYRLNPVTTANTYLANDIALNEQTVFTIPIHQKTDNFELRIFNDSPFPVSLNSMMWEGNYSPRFYKRA